MSNGGGSKSGGPSGTPMAARQWARTDLQQPAGTLAAAVRQADPAVVRANTEPTGVPGLVTSGQMDDAPPELVETTGAAAVLQDMMRTQAGMPAQPVGATRPAAAQPASVQEQRVVTPPIQSRPAEAGNTTKRLLAIEEMVRVINGETIVKLADQLNVLKGQLDSLAARLDEAGRKDDAHDSMLTGLENGLAEAENDIKAAQAAADAAQAAADAAQAAADAAKQTGDAACRRLVEEFGEP